MNKIKALWQYALFRFFVLAVSIGVGSFVVLHSAWDAGIRIFHVHETYYVMWSFFIVPMLLMFWVWRRFFGRLILRLVRTVNKAAE